MTTTAIDYIWQAIRESERSDKLQFLDDEILIKAKAARLTQPRLISPRGWAFSLRITVL